VRAGLRFGFGDVVDHTAPWIVFGIAVASLAEPALHDTWLAALPWGVDVLLFALLGMPFYVCASGATPLAAVLIHKGVSPGAALAFLLVGPVTNGTTFGVLSRLHSPRMALAFGGMLAGLTVGLGLLVNLFMPKSGGIALYTEASADASAFQIIAVIAFTAVIAMSVLRQGPRGFVAQILNPYGDDRHDHHGHGRPDRAHSHD
jgi:hypothetical protein